MCNVQKLGKVFFLDSHFRGKDVRGSLQVHKWHCDSPLAKKQSSFLPLAKFFFGFPLSWERRARVIASTQMALQFAFGEEAI